MESREELSIGSVARRAGVRPSALRYYESIGLLPPPARVNGRRRYDGTVLRRLDIIGLAKEAGFTMEEVKTLLHGFDSNMPPSARWRTLAEQKLSEVDALIRRAENMKRLLNEGLNCDCLSFEDCVLVEGVCFEDGTRESCS